jgi:hypothetical protein
VSRKSDERWMDRHFPTSHAREVADAAMDAIPETEPMTTFLDRWIAAYLKAGGRTDLKFD